MSTHALFTFHNKLILQISLNIRDRSLVNDCETRWGSTYNCVERFIELEPGIRKVLANDYSSTHLLLSGDQMQVLKDVIAALKPVSTLTDILSGIDNNKNHSVNKHVHVHHY